MAIRLLSKVRDKLSGFEGYATARCIYATGCIHIEVTSNELRKDEVKRVAGWFDEIYLECLGDPALKVETTKGPGGPNDSHPAQMEHPA